MGYKGKGKSGSGVSKLGPRPRGRSRNKGRVPVPSKDHGLVHKSVEEMGYWRCVGCNCRFPLGDKPGKVLYRGRHLILCNRCKGEWVWVAGREYLRRREIQSKWQGQNKLTSSISSIYGKSYVVNEVKMISWGVSHRGGYLSFDVAVPALNLLVDYHGEQHYTYPNRWHGTRVEYEEQRKRDAEKHVLASENGWSYIVFSYNEPVGNVEWVRGRLLSFCR